MKRLCLVDVSAMYFRAFYAIRPLSNSAGLPTNALFGFLSITGKMLRQLKPDYLAYCFDRKDGSFRNEKYEEYKANRSEMPEDLRPQVPYVRKLAEALNIPSIDIQGYEADDVIGMLARFSEKENIEVIIVSGDKDFAQLIDGQVKMFDPMKEVLYDEAGVMEKWGVRPDQIIDYLSIVGDASDNVPGIKGVGPKGAVKLLSEYGTLEKIYENVEEISGKAMKQKIKDAKDLAFLSKELVSIVTENHTGIEHIEELKWKGPNFKDLDSLLEELEFNNMGKRLRKDSSYILGESGNEDEAEKEAPSVVWTEQDLEKYQVEELNQVEELKKKLTVDQADYIYLMQDHVYISPDQAQQIYSLPLKVFEEGASALEPNLWKGHDLKSLWRSFGIQSAKASFDTMIAEYLILSKPIGSFDDLVDSYFSLKTISDPRAYLLALKQIEEEQIQKLKKIEIEKVYFDLELPTLEVLHCMENNGITVDREILKKQATALHKEVESLKKLVFDETEQEFNLDSPKQLGKVLFEDMGLPVVKKTKTGYSTNSDVLNKLKPKYPWVENIISYRELKKLLSTYLEALPELIDENTGRIHTHFNQAVTATGRLSSTEPNLQNIPIRTSHGNAIREAFVAPEGKLLVSADYSQIELRLLAHITKDPGLLKAFNEDKDIHTATASEVFEVPFEEVDSEMRRRAKAVNFGIAYGMGAFSLADNLGISRKEAKQIIDRYFSRFKNVKNYMSDVVEEAKEKTYVESILGRRRYVPELQSSNAILRKNGERIAINSPMQASASDIVKKAMVELGCDDLGAKMLLQVHDELIFEVDEDKADALIDKVKTCMENVIELDVPLKVNASKGKSWKEAH